MERPTGIKVYWLATRPFAFTASVTPILLGTAIAWVENRAFNALDFLLALIGAMAIHAVANLVGDRYDLRKGLDRPDNYGAINILLRGLISDRAHRNLTLAMVALSVAIAVFFVATAGSFILWLCIFGLISAVFYTAPPVNFKYVGLGDFGVFLSFGILMTVGAYFVQTHTFSWDPVIFAIPIGLLVDAILHSNNYRDIDGDRIAGIRTIAMMLGHSGALKMYYVLVVGAFLSIPLMILFAKLTPFALVTYVTIPVALKVLRKANARTSLEPAVFGIIDVETAQLHMMFGLLLTAGIVIGCFV